MFGTSLPQRKKFPNEFSPTGCGFVHIGVTIPGTVYHEAQTIPEPDYTFTVSARSKQTTVPVFQFLRRHFGHIPLNRIESLFGFVEYTPLYGGRVFHRRELSERDVFQLNNAGIGLRLPLSNHFVSPAGIRGQPGVPAEISP